MPSPLQMSDAPEDGPIRDYRLTVRIRNNRLLTYIERTGAISIKAFCDSHKSLSYQTVAQLVRMDRPVYRISTGWTRPALQLSRILGQPPEELFRGKQLLAEFHTRKVERTADEEEIVSINESSMLAFPASEPDPETVLINKDIVSKLLGYLTEHQRITVKASMGIDGPKLTMDQIAELIGVSSRTTANQIFHKAMARMRKRAHQLHLIPSKELSEQEKADWLVAAKDRAAGEDDAERRARQGAKEAKAKRLWDVEASQLAFELFWYGLSKQFIDQPFVRVRIGPENLAVGDEDSSWRVRFYANHIYTVPDEVAGVLVSLRSSRL